MGIYFTPNTWIDIIDEHSFEIASSPSRLKPGLTKLLNNVDLPINYDLFLDGEEQEDDIEISSMICAIK